MTLTTKQNYRFWRAVDMRGPVVRADLGPCWVWTKKPNSQDYGRIRLNGLQRLAHRVSFAVIHGAVRDGLGVLHKCDNPLCIRPSHLFAGTQADNMRDMASKGRSTRGKSLSRPKAGYPVLDRTGSR